MLFRVLSIAAFLAAFAACTEYDLNEARNVGGPGDDNDDGTDMIPPDEPLGGIKGRVCAPDGDTWVVGADVSAVHEWGTTTAITGQDGWFVLDNLPVGTYTVTIEKGSFASTFDVDVVADQVTELSQEECLDQGDVKIAVVTGDFDRIQDLLADLGLQFDVIDGLYGNAATQFLRNPTALAQYDIIFFNCGMSDAWTSSRAEVGTNLHTFVANGGSVYASDWAYYLVEAAYPNANTFHGNDGTPGAAYVGDSGIITANVIDPNMATILGSNSAQLDYNLPSWAVMETVDLGVTLLEGQFSYFDYASGSGVRHGPLASRLDDGDGSIIYTSFHNEAQTTFDMELLLQEIILSL